MLERLKKELGLTPLTPAERRAEINRLVKRRVCIGAVGTAFGRAILNCISMIILFSVLGGILTPLLASTAFLLLNAAVPMFAIFLIGSLWSFFLCGVGIKLLAYVEEEFSTKKNGLPWTALIQIGWVLSISSIFVLIAMFMVLPLTFPFFIATVAPWLIAALVVGGGTALMGVGALGFYLSPKAPSGNNLGVEESRISLPPYSSEHSQGEHLMASASPLPTPVTPEALVLPSSAENSELEGAYTT